jgi:ribose/xylose/arabinose/galactoside ABC-type transport system permease subunit
VLKYTVFGQSLYAVGGSSRAATFAGIRTERVTLAAFVISGLCASVAGVMLASAQGSAVPNIADPLLLSTYAAAFLSTVLLSRGRFHVFGTLAGGVAVVWVASGIVEGGVSFTWTQVINGAVLVAVVALSSVLRRKRA